MRLRSAVSYGWIIAVMVLLAGAAWLTQNPEAEIVERAEDWPVLGGLATAFRQAYLPPPPIPREESVEQQVELVTPPSVDSTYPRYVWVQPGTSLYEKPDLQSPILTTMTVISNLSVITQRDDWYWVWVPRQGARPLEAWVLLVNYRAPSQEVLNAADPVVPLPATPPDAARIGLARGLMQEDGAELECGRQPLLTDAPQDEVVRVCAQLIANLESVYQERYGLRPVSPPAEAILLFRRGADYRAFRDLEEVPFDSGLAHASPAWGYLAIYRGDRTNTDVLATLVHESTHLLNRRSLGPALPPWLNEGMADDLAESRIGPDGVITPDVLGADSRVEKGRTVRTGGLAAAVELQEAIQADDLPTLRELVIMDEARFYSTARVQLHYALSSFWVRYLASDFNPQLTRGFRGFLQDVAAGKRLDSDLLTSRLGADWDSLEKEFRVWVHLQFVRPPSETPEISHQVLFLPPLDPTIGVMLLLPDGDFLLEAFESGTAGLIGSGPMRRSHRDGHTGLAHWNLPQAVDNMDAHS